MSARVKAYIETCRRIRVIPDQADCNELADELNNLVKSSINFISDVYNDPLSSVRVQSEEKMLKTLSTELRQLISGALIPLSIYISESKLGANQTANPMPQANMTNAIPRIKEFEEHAGRQFTKLSDLKWDEVKAFSETIPTHLEHVDFLKELTRLPDDGIVDGRVMNPPLHHRNHNEFLRPLQEECNRLLGLHFNLELILQRAESIEDHNEALVYLWKVWRDYLKHHPQIRQNSHSPEELAFRNAINFEIQHRKDLRGSYLFGNQSNFNAEGDLIMGDSYKAGQVGAMGPNAHAHNMTFNQLWNQLQGSVNLSDLANQLAKLRQEMRKEAVEPEHDIAVAVIAKAEQAAKEGDGAKTIEHLKSAGKWALDVGTKIGTNLAVEVLKEATGLKHSSQS